MTLKIAEIHLQYLPLFASLTLTITIAHHPDQEAEKRPETPAPVSATPQSTRKDETVVDVQVISIQDFKEGVLPAYYNFLTSPEPWVKKILI